MTASVGAARIAPIIPNKDTAIITVKKRISGWIFKDFPIISGETIQSIIWFNRKYIIRINTASRIGGNPRILCPPTITVMRVITAEVIIPKTGTIENAPVMIDSIEENLTSREERIR